MRAAKCWTARPPSASYCASASGSRWTAEMDFSYQALDRAGIAVSGVIQAENPETGAERVRQMGLFPMSLAPSGDRRQEKNGAARAERSERPAAPAARSGVSS